MTQACRTGFDETLLSGYVDSELTQADQQRVRLHLEECRVCRSLMEDLLKMRQAAMSTPFPIPLDEEWREVPRTSGGRWLRQLGWFLMGIWILGAGALTLHRWITGSGPWLEKVLMASLIGGGVLLLLSVLVDRLEALRTDRYRRVEK